MRRTITALGAVAVLALGASPVFAQQYPPGDVGGGAVGGGGQAGGDTAGGDLPRTGIDAGLLGVAGLGALAAGGAVVASSRRKRRDSAA